MICTKEQWSHQNSAFGADEFFVNCDGDPYLMRAYLMVQKIKIKDAGSFYFEMKLNTPDIPIYFIVYQASNHFDRSTLQPIRCSLAGLHVGESTPSVGLSTQEQDTEEGAYNFDLVENKNGYVAAIDAEAGDEYVIVTNVFQPNRILTTTYCGTATFVNDDSVCEDIFVSTDKAESPSIGIYPNPSQDRITVSGMDEDLKASYLLMDQLGRIILSGPIVTQSISTKALASGIYMLQVLDTSNKVVFMEKIVKL